LLDFYKKKQCVRDTQIFCESSDRCGCDAGGSDEMVSVNWWTVLEGNYILITNLMH